MGAPYGPRDDAALLAELTELTRQHRAGCSEYARIVGPETTFESFDDLPYLHVGLFKRLSLSTTRRGVSRGRTLLSSSTTGAAPSAIALDDASAALQGRSVAAILGEFVGAAKRPLLIVDDRRSLRGPHVAARTAAALGLRAIASDLHFVLDSASNEIRWDKVRSVLEGHASVLVYATSAVLWQRWAEGKPPPDVAALLKQRQLTFVHSGGWKRLERAAVARDTFDETLRGAAGAGSSVVDFYGLVEQNGVVFPLCEGGVRHVPRFAHAIVRDLRTLAPTREAGLLQLMNPLALGAPYHNVLTEDLGRLVLGPCACGRKAPAFELLGRRTSAEVRGCSDVATAAPASTTASGPRETARATTRERLGASSSFQPHGAGTPLSLLSPHDVGRVLADWERLAKRMARDKADDFSRDDWAYLLRFLREAHLTALLKETFPLPEGETRRYFTPRSPVGVWLPSNVTLLGPLLVILLSLGGATVTLKVSSRGADLTGRFVDFAKDELTGTALGDYLTSRLSVVRMDRDDARNRELAARAQVRVIFGEDGTARSVDALPHPVGSLTVAFTDRASEAWLLPRAALTADVQDALLRVFSVFGQAACTAPRRVVLVGGDAAAAAQLARGLAERPNERAAALADASERVLAVEEARAHGFSVVDSTGGLVILHGPPRLPLVRGRAVLHVTFATEEEALATTPPNLQTIGVAYGDARMDESLIGKLIERGAARIVPLARMHDFAAEWDGIEVLRSLFDVSTVDA